MKIGHSEQVIDPEIGCALAGYGYGDIAVRIHDDLKVTVLLLDDGEATAAVISYDLLGMDEPIARKLRKDAAEILGCPEANVILTCTHTHSGPHLRSRGPHRADLKYAEKLYGWSASAVRKAMETWREADVYFYSCKCDQNYNRRYIEGANVSKGTPGHRTLEPLASEFTDQELGMLIFAEPGSVHPAGVLLNYAAHPLTTHSPGLGSHQVSADYPGALRSIMEENSSWCVFTDGAAGDIFPKDSECGWESAVRCASGIATEAMRGICNACRNKADYLLKDPKIKASIVPLRLKRRVDHRADQPALPVYDGKPEFEVELQLLAIGDICLVGVPGELLAEVGQEIKWHSPYRRTFILYNSMGYLGYLPHSNAYVAGGYEVSLGACHIAPFESLKIVCAAVDGMRELHGPLPQEIES
ncbi:MAG: hypothetical protein IJS14_09320 [Lentisphaeria bacterium]|nr:hypothetical protein [Lentisphaeria bacterium]